MKYITVEEYIALRYTKIAPPSKRTIIRMINIGDVPGKKVGRRYYIDIDAEIQKTGNLLVDRVLGL
jgi:hypothetical protein